MFKSLYKFRLVILFFLPACNHVTVSKKENAVRVIIDVQPFTDISTEEAAYVFDEVKTIYPDVILKPAIDLPSSAFYAARKRHRADSLIHYLDRHTSNGHITIGLTGKDISTNKDSIKDWGVIGLGFCPGKACIASTFRLSKQERSSQFFKVAIHELGHTEGLSHCKNKYCFMRDAEGHNTTGEEKYFCADCETYLEKKGWAFNKNL